MDKGLLSATIQIISGNKLIVDVYHPEAVEYGFYLYKDETIIEMISFSERNRLSYWLSESGQYSVKAYARNDKDERISQWTDRLDFDVEEVFVIDERIRKKKSVWQQIKEVIQDIIANRTILFQMAKYDYKLENKDTYLGKMWAIITPLLQIATYWFVFGIGLRNGADVDGIPFLAWLLAGLIPWFFISGCITRGANSIYSKAGLVSKMQFSIATIPISKIVQEMYEFFVMIIIMLVGLFFMKIYPNIYWLNLIYYFLYAVTFMISLALITSVFTMVARDFSKLLASLVRLLFYLTPILWVMESMPIIYQKIMNYNPIYYVVRGFRESILYRQSFYVEWELALIMWSVNIVLFFFGCMLQAKFKNKFIDLM